MESRLGSVRSCDCRPTIGQDGHTASKPMQTFPLCLQLVSVCFRLADLMRGTFRMEANHKQGQIDTSKVLWKAAQNGDHSAFTALVLPYAGNLRRLARRFTRNEADAEDVCQEALLKAFTKLNKFAGTASAEGEFRSWLARITMNCAIDFIRRRRPKQDVPLEACDQVHAVSGAGGWGENPELSYARQERSRAVANAIAGLPADLRRVCLLRNLMELSTKEAAARLGLPTITVRVRLFRAHSQLRKRLGAAWGDGQGGPALRWNGKRRELRNEALDFQGSAVFACGD